MKWAEVRPARADQVDGQDADDDQPADRDEDKTELPFGYHGGDYSITFVQTPPASRSLPLARGKDRAGAV